MVDVVIPVLHPGADFPGFVGDLIALGQGSNPFRVRLMLVDDASRDDAWERIVQLHKRFPGHVRALRLGRRLGQQGATLLGILHSDAGVVVTMDDDGQHPPHELIGLLQPVLAGRADLAYGLARKDSRPWWRRAGSAAYVAGVAIAYGLRPRSVTSFRCLSAALVKRFKARKTTFRLIDIALLRLAGTAKGVKVDFCYRNVSSSRYPLAALALFSLRAALPVRREVSEMEREIVESLQ